MYLIDLFSLLYLLIVYCSFMPQVDLLSIEKMAAGEFSILDYCDAFLITFQKIHPRPQRACPQTGKERFTGSSF